MTYKHKPSYNPPTKAAWFLGLSVVFVSVGFYVFADDPGNYPWLFSQFGLAWMLFVTRVTGI